MKNGSELPKKSLGSGAQNRDGRVSGNTQFFLGLIYTAFADSGKWEGFDHVNRFNNTSWVAVVTPSKREVPRGVRNSKVRRQDKFRRDWSRH